MTPEPSPPTLARWLLERVLPADACDDVSGDLHEVFERDCRTVGRLRARARYWRKALQFAWHCGRERIAIPRLGFSWVDIKLGLRMLIRYPGLTVVGSLGIAVVIAGGSVVAIFDHIVNAPLPFDEGDRIVVLENWDTEWNNQEHRALFDYAAWRGSLQSIDDIGAFRRVSRNLVVGERVPRLVYVAEMTASGFDLTRVPPLLGRYLVEDDERADAPPVVVVSEEVWRRDLGGTADVLGSTIRLGAEGYAIVGVMPQGYRFPESDHLWLPLRPDPADYLRRAGPVVYVFGRLAPGVDLAGAQAELTTAGQRAALAYPETHGRLRPRVTPYARSYFDDMEGYEIPVFRAVVVLLLIIIGSNVAVLVYARTTTRQTEIALRSALGASRGRIVGQLFAESMVLALLAAGLGLLITEVAIRQTLAVIEQFPGFPGVPFWMDPSLASGTVVRDVVAITLLGAAIVGLVPALQATGRRVQRSLQHVSARGTPWRFGHVHSVLIILQVAVAVALLPAAGSLAWSSFRYALADPGFPAEEFLTARVRMDREATPSASDDGGGVWSGALFGQRLEELTRRLEAEPYVSTTTLLVSVPGGEPSARVDVELAPRDASTVQVSVGQIGTDYLDAFGVPVLSGRNFNAGDVGSPGTLRDADGDGMVDSSPAAVAARRVAIVNDSFVREVFGGGPALGRRIRLANRDADTPGPWLEVVGVAGDFPASAMEPGVTAAKIYLPISTGLTGWPRLAVHLREGTGDAEAEWLRRIAAQVDPRLQLQDVQPLDRLMGAPQTELNLAALGTGVVAFAVILQSAAGLYALMSFAVAHRRREIGIRAALGGNPRRILGGIFARAFWQLAAGISVGLAIAVAAGWVSGGELSGGADITMLPIAAALMMTVGLLAAVGPARRGLRVQPIEVLRED